MTHQNVSPVNFFMPDLKKYPLFKDATRTAVHLKPGDCMFIPAYFYYHLQGSRQMTGTDKTFSGLFPKEYFAMNTTSMAEALEERYDTKIATAVSLKFEANSELLSNFMDAIERKIIS